MGCWCRLSSKMTMAFELASVELGLTSRDSAMMSRAHLRLSVSGMEMDWVEPPPAAKDPIESGSYRELMRIEPSATKWTLPESESMHSLSSQYLT